ncbi:MAG: hypothetical protein PVI06_20185 [Desulfobacterales bacterium]
MKFVCPLPPIWEQIYERLLKAWEKTGKRGPGPPVPLILAGWAFSNDVEKAHRWKQTIIWAEDNKLEDLLPKLKERQKYMVPEMTTYEVGPLGGPMYLPWDYEPKARPSDETLERTLLRLKQDWRTIAGENLSTITEPLEFSGKKARKLLVKADFQINPPWGKWDSLALGEKRRAFTRFRQRVNDAIAPHMVDHIEFLPRKE